MARGVLCREGFLGNDTRPLEAIIDSDHAVVVGLGATHQRLAEKLQEAYLKARAGLGTRVALDDRLTAVYREFMGRMPCPWGGCGVFPKGEVKVTDASTGRKLVFTPLVIHLIARHGFYQGRGSRYRLEPAHIHRLFRMG